MLIVIFVVFLCLLLGMISSNAHAKKRLNVFYFVLIISISFLFPSICWSNIFESQQVFDFANSLFEEGDYRNAINEYNRYLYFNPDGAFAVEAQYRIAASYLNMEKFSKAIDAYRKVLKFDISQRLRQRTRTKIAECYLFKRDYSQAIDEFNQFLDDYPQSDLAIRNQFMLGATYTEMEKWDLAEKTWRKIYSGTRSSESQSLRNQTRNLTQLLKHFHRLPKRNAFLSGTLSAFLPGLGQAYCSRFSDGFYAFMVIGTLFAGTAYYIEQERYKIAVPLGAVSLIFYAGNIYGGVRAAKVFNYKQKSDFVKMLKARIQEIAESGELKF